MRRYCSWLVVVALCIACGPPPQPASQPVVRLTRNTTLAEMLAQEYGAAIPGTDFRLVDVVGSVAAVRAIQHRDADLGVAFADVVYEAQTRLAEHPDPSLGELRGIAALQVAPVHLITRLGLDLTSVFGLSGHRIGMGEEASGQERLAELIISAYQLSPDSIEGVSVPPDTAARALTAGTVDAAFVTGYYPLPQVIDALSHGSHLIPIDGGPADQLTSEYPFLRRAVIPANTYPAQTDPVRTIAVDRLLVCRDDLDDELVYAMTRRLFESLPRMSSLLRSSLRLMDIQEASATPIPLHDGAARYYRERELTR